jgi:hypothetical protein
MQDTFQLTTGQPRSGKGLRMMTQIHEIYKRNKKWYEKTGIKRHLALNLHLSEEYLEDVDDSFFLYWTSWRDLLLMKDTDIFWDEISIMLDSYKYEQLTMEQLHWLTHYAKLGNEIFANTQDISQLARRARLLCTSVTNMVKIVGSPTPSNTKPPVEKIWGLCVGRNLENYRDDECLKEPEYSIFPTTALLIQPKWTYMYDTREIIEPQNVIYVNRYTKICEDDGYKKVFYR